MTQIEKAIARFNANWKICFPKMPAPLDATDIIAWYNFNHDLYVEIKLNQASGTYYKARTRERITGLEANRYMRQNELVNDAGIIASLYVDSETLESPDDESWW